MKHKHPLKRGTVHSDKIFVCTAYDCDFSITADDILEHVAKLEAVLKAAQFLDGIWYEVQATNHRFETHVACDIRISELNALHEAVKVFDLER